MASTLIYTVPDFLPFTKIISADVNSRFNDIKNRFNFDGTTNTGLGDDNIQSNTVSGGGLTRSTKLKAGTPDYVLINDGAGLMSEEALLAITRGGTGISPTLAGSAGLALTVNNAETGFELNTPIAKQITESFTSDVATLTAGETIATQESVCLDLHNGSGTPIYRVFRTESDVVNRKYNFIGFALNDAAVVAGVYTYTISAAFVASNVISTTINGRAYSTTYASSSDATLQAIATQIATDQDVFSAIVTVVGGNQTGTDDRVITITSVGGLSLNMTSIVTLGVSQPTVTILNTIPATGENVRIRVFGPMPGFSSLTVGGNYYVSDVAGEITQTPDAAPIFAGQAISDTVLFVNKNLGNYQFTTQDIFVRSHGSSTVADSGATQTSEHFNFVAWSAGVSAASGVRNRGITGGSTGYGIYHMWIDGFDASTTLTLLTLLYNKSSWSIGANRASARRAFPAHQFNGFMYAANGLDSGDSPSTTVFKWNGASWSTTTSTASGSFDRGCFTQGGFIHFAGGSGTGSHETLNAADVLGSATVIPTTDSSYTSGVVGSNGYYVNTLTDDSYKWDGASWGSAVNVTYTPAGTAERGAAAAYRLSGLKGYINGGSTDTVALNTSSSYNDISWSSETSSATSRSSAAGSVI